MLTCLFDSRRGGDGLRHGRGRRPRTARAAGGQVHRHGALHAPLPRVPARPDRPGGGGRARQGLGAHQLLRVQVVQVNHRQTVVPAETTAASLLVLLNRLEYSFLCGVSLGLLAASPCVKL